MTCTVLVLIPPIGVAQVVAVGLSADDVDVHLHVLNNY